MPARGHEGFGETSSARGRHPSASLKAGRLDSGRGLVVNWLQFVANGLAVGGIVLLGAVGLSLLFGVKRFANFAHGDFMTLGAYATYALWVDAGWGFAPAALAAVGVTVLGGLACETGIFARLRARPPAIALLASIGLSFALQNILKAVWSTRDRSYPLQAETAIPLGLGVALTPTKLLIIVVAAATAVGLHLLLTRTRLGKALRATADNRDLARITGIPTARVEGAAWALSMALAAMAGVALGAVTILNPTMGFGQLLLIFAAVILGGIGSPYGAMLGALVIGVALEVSKPALELGGVASSLSPAVAFAILVVVLLLKPEGIAGEARAARGRRRREVGEPG